MSEKEIKRVSTMSLADMVGVPEGAVFSGQWADTGAYPRWEYLIKENTLFMRLPGESFRESTHMMVSHFANKTLLVRAEPSILEECLGIFKGLQYKASFSDSASQAFRRRFNALIEDSPVFFIRNEELVASCNNFTIPVGHEIIAAASAGMLKFTMI